MMDLEEHSSDLFDPASATAQEAMIHALSLEEPRDAEETVTHLNQHADEIESLLWGRGRWAVLKGESARGWLTGPFGFLGPTGAIAFGIGIGLAWLLELQFSLFVVATLLSYIVLRLAIVKPDHRDWLAGGTVLGAGIVAAWAIGRQGPLSPAHYDDYLLDALVAAPEYWHDLAARAVERLPIERRQKLVLEAFSRRPDDLWHLLPLVPTERVVRAALSRGPRSSATADFHSFGALIRRAPVEPVLEAIRAGAGNRDVLIRAVAASGNPAAIDLLVATLSERNERLREVARDGLIGMGPAVLPRLFEAFDLQRPKIQQGVARALRGLGPNRDVETFAARMLDHDGLDPLAASELRRIVLTHRALTQEIRFSADQVGLVDATLASIPAPQTKVRELHWRDGIELSDDAARCLVNLVSSEGPELRCGELAGLRLMLEADSRNVLMEHAQSNNEHPVYRMVLADEAELLNYHPVASRSRQKAEEWIDVLERHASLAAVHALDELWHTGIDGVVQTSAMAALMRISGEYDGLESFADRALVAALRDATHPLHDSYARGQFSRFEQMMISGRRMKQDEFWKLYQTLPAQHVLWGVYAPDGSLHGTFRLDEEYEAVDADDERYVFGPYDEIGIAHTAELGPEGSVTWAEVFSDYELVPHFEQLQRPARHLSRIEEEESLFVEFDEQIRSSRLESALIRRGWRPSPTDVETVYTLTKPVHRGRSSFTAVIELDPGFGEDPDELQRVECLAFWNGHHHVLSSVVTKVRLGEVDAVIFSEIVLELREVLVTASTSDERSLPSIPTRLD